MMNTAQGLENKKAIHKTLFSALHRLLSSNKPQSYLFFLLSILEIPLRFCCELCICVFRTLTNIFSVALCENSKRIKVVKYFLQTVHHICLTAS